MNAHTAFELSPGLVLDARRAVWLPEQGTLAVADLHLGFSWSHRASGNLLPVAADDGTIRRLRLLVDDYRPREVVVLGGVVHGFSAPAPVREELRRLVGEIGDRATLRLLSGNHDGWLPEVLEEAGLALAVAPTLQCGPHLLLHGHRHGGAPEVGGRVIFGHEHPAIALSAGVATHARCPCFLVGDDALLLPAFSSWAAGVPVRSGEFMSPYARVARFTQAVAIVAEKLLPLAWP
jgi:putative SbcD/Mre11-related phosphoesterase